MALTLALFQAAMNESASQATEGGDPILYIIFGVVALGTLAVIGLRFFHNLWETVTSPAASLGHIGQSNNFFVSLAVVFFGGLIAAIILLSQRAAIFSSVADFIRDYTDGIASSGVSPLHAPDMAASKADQIFGMFTYYYDQLLFLPVILVLCWMVFGFFTWVATKMFGGQAGLGNFLGALAYPLLFVNIGMACSAIAWASALGIYAGSTPTFSLFGIFGWLLTVYGMILYLIGFARAADLTVGRIIGVLIVLMIVNAGFSYLFWYLVSPLVIDLTSEIVNFNPAQ